MYSVAASMIGYYQENSMGDLSPWARLKYENIVWTPGIGYSIICHNLIEVIFTLNIDVLES